MLRTLAFVAALALAATAASAQKLDANGKCHAADGKFAKAEVCSGAKAAAPDAGPYKLDAKGKCHDAKGRWRRRKCAPRPTPRQPRPPCLRRNNGC